MQGLSGRRRIWLVGASSGIGEALARRLLEQGHRVALSARRRDPLERLAEQHAGALVLPCDLTDAQSVHEAAGTLDARFGGLDVLLHVAGTCEYLDAHRFDPALVERVFAVNFHGAVRVIDAALPLLRHARDPDTPRPLLAAVSSAAAYLPLPRAEAYGASKAALSHFLESLRIDLADEGIDISLVHPGFVATPLTARNDFTMPMRIDADTAARAILDGLERRRLDIHVPRRFTTLVKLAGLLPPALRLRLGRRLIRRRSPSEAAS
ncbi:SDR family NAD(P)-dependent oxidoreductase [Modicisalibacter tunisiensis]|uniref:SDR family NAD(P)-dependent oxidoreductase n=1 Tax=Modicisalibacter tunisiensis TaxID=390637 RepID=A0ABS7WWU6_9GAMM|nr:SDR family NAD(P)-dependent oxidoreductase [Modicisalibacter tunisiensis]MBZ9566639.1 SDR family NAD(P)-dependent oxidoreductase [Modicisalibacter tunisiensis]